MPFQRMASEEETRWETHPRRSQRTQRRRLLQRVRDRPFAPRRLDNLVDDALLERFLCRVAVARQEHLAQDGLGETRRENRGHAGGAAKRGALQRSARDGLEAGHNLRERAGTHMGAPKWTSFIEPQVRSGCAEGS